MKWQLLISDQFDRIERELALIFEGLTAEDLDRQPTPDCNSIGWLVWHLTRSLDRNMSELMDKEQLWISDKWHARFNRSSDPGDTGYKHTSEQVRSFVSPGSYISMGYLRAILNRIQGYIENNLNESDLDRTTLSPTLQNTASVMSRLSGEVRHAFMHIGQADYVRGLLKQRG